MEYVQNPFPNEVKDQPNLLFEGITEDQKRMMIELRIASRSPMKYCRWALEKAEWSHAVAYSVLRHKGKLNILDV